MRAMNASSPSSSSSPSCPSSKKSKPASTVAWVGFVLSMSSVYKESNISASASDGAGEAARRGILDLLQLQAFVAYFQEEGAGQEAEKHFGTALLHFFADDKAYRYRDGPGGMELPGVAPAPGAADPCLSQLRDFTSLLFLPEHKPLSQQPRR